MSNDKKLALLRPFESSLVYIVAFDGDDDCTITDRICVGVDGSARRIDIVKELLKGTGFTLEKRKR